MTTLFLTAIAFVLLIILTVGIIRSRKKNDGAIPDAELTKDEEPREEQLKEPKPEKPELQELQEQPEKPELLEKPELPDPKPEQPKEENEDDILIPKNDHLIADLHRVFEEEKVFLRPDIHIDDVAKMLLTNRTYITRLMRQEYGLSFIEYVNISRIQYSQSLLYSSNMTLDEIAERSGFQSTSNYCRAFKRYIGTSPLAWKNSLPTT